MSDFSGGIDESGVPMHSKRLGRELAMEFLFGCDLRGEIPGAAGFEQFLETARDEFQMKDNRQAHRAEDYARKLYECVALDRDAVDSEQFYDICSKTFRMARAKGLKCGLGGSISAKSVDFIARLNFENLIDKFETRKVVFRADSIKYGEKIFNKALEFELLWLKSKRRYYSGVKAEDEKRIAMLEKRLNG